jgi:hypothetical protein
MAERHLAMELKQGENFEIGIVAHAHTRHGLQLMLIQDWAPAIEDKATRQPVVRNQGNAKATESRSAEKKRRWGNLLERGPKPEQRPNSRTREPGQDSQSAANARMKTKESKPGKSKTNEL